MNLALDQYEALREGRGLVELPDWSSISLTGADRQTFLNSFCTNDVKRLAPGQSCEAFITNVKGKILGHGLVDCREAELVFITVPNQAEAIVAHLDRYIIREDVQLRDTTSERRYTYAGDRHSLPEPLPGRWIAWPLLGRETGGLFATSTDELADVRAALLAGGAVPCDTAAFETLRIEAGTPLFGVDFDADNFPQEVGRDQRAISFTKGCYLGQETVARIDALGHVNRRLVGVRFDGREVPTAGTELRFGDAVVGRITSAAFSPQLNAPLALAMVRREWTAPGAKLESTAGPFEVVKPPLAD